MAGHVANFPHKLCFSLRWRNVCVVDHERHDRRIIYRVNLLFPFMSLTRRLALLITAMSTTENATHARLSRESKACRACGPPD